MQIKIILLLLLLAAAVPSVFGQQAEQQKPKNSQDKEQAGKKQNAPLSTQGGKRASTFKPSEKVSPDVPVSFPADI